jgi:hypothetical protein
MRNRQHAGERRAIQATGGARRDPRQASEQYFTSSQLRAHRFRQVIGRPQVAQGLVGRWRLLPLKGVMPPPSQRLVFGMPGPGACRSERGQLAVQDRISARPPQRAVGRHAASPATLCCPCLAAAQPARQCAGVCAAA